VTTVGRRLRATTTIYGKPVCVIALTGSGGPPDTVWSGSRVEEMTAPLGGTAVVMVPLERVLQLNA
jgi:hypothetical protein